jgi:two-component system sensor histidine kinase MtrB
MRTLGLRTRVTLFFALMALIAGIVLSVATYLFARSYLVDERTSSARSQAITNAATVREVMAADRDVVDFFDVSLPSEEGGFAALTARAELLATTDLARTDAFPDAMRSAVEAGTSGMQRFTIDGEPYIGVGVNLGQGDASYFESFSLETADRTLRAIWASLAIGTIATTALATFFGWSTSGRLLRPLSRVADAAGEIAEGGLDTRMEPETDRDLDRLVGAFNNMADAVQERIEREARFASDVSHELRSPITALSAAIEVVHGRREELPERTQQALDVVVNQVRRFDDMVIDLLELSRLDAGATDLVVEQVNLYDLTDRIATRLGFVDVPIEVGEQVTTVVTTDKVRYERILSNLLLNAYNHAGGPTRISLEPARSTGQLLIAVEDAGPGVAHSERTRIFERFARGSAARHRVGTGLGLALVGEHANALGGQAWVEDRPGGGARFVVQIKTVYP